MKQSYKSVTPKRMTISLPTKAEVRMTFRRFKEKINSSGSSSPLQTVEDTIGRTHVEEETKKSEPDNDETKGNGNRVKSWKDKIKKFLMYGGVGLGMGKIVGYAYNKYGTAGAMAITAAIGGSMILGSRIYEKISRREKNSENKMGQAIMIERIAGEIFVFPSIIGVASHLAHSVRGPISGMLTGGLSMIAGFLAHMVIFYGGWGIANVKKYSKTGFGKLGEIAELPKQVVRTIKTIVRREPLDDGKEAKAESFLREFAEMAGKGIVFTVPYFAIRLVSGFIAGFSPEIYLETFIAVMRIATPWAFPLYVNFYSAIEQRINSVKRPENEVG